MKKQAAGIIVWRPAAPEPQVLLAHFGGPYWKNKDKGAWTVFKGLAEPEDRDLLATALREFSEETGLPAPGRKALVYLGKFDSATKKNHLWALRREDFPTEIHANTFRMEWPPHSGKMQSFPEIDKVQWFTFPEAEKKIIPSLRKAIVKLKELIENKNGD